MRYPPCQSKKGQQFATQIDLVPLEREMRIAKSLKLMMIYDSKVGLQAHLTPGIPRSPDSRIVYCPPAHMRTIFGLRPGPSRFGPSGLVQRTNR